MGMKLLFVLLAGTGLLQVSSAKPNKPKVNPVNVDDSPAPLSCYSCKDETVWSVCLKTNETCRLNYLCESRKQSNGSTVGPYSAGCKKATVCNRHGQLSCPNQQSNGVTGNGDSGGHSSNGDSGSHSSNGDSEGHSSNAANVQMCFTCCSTDYCNNQPPDSTTTTSTTIPATTTTSTTTPATTTTETATPATTTTETATPATTTTETATPATTTTETATPATTTTETATPGTTTTSTTTPATTTTETTTAATTTTTTTTPVYGIWAPWNAWSGCSATCGSGVRIRARTCGKTSGSDLDCVGENPETQSCLTGRCPTTTTTSTSTPVTTTTPTTTQATSTCTGGYTYNSSLELCYKLYQQASNFTTAQSICAGDGGRVVHITLAMTEFLRAVIKDLYPTVYYWWIDGQYLSDSWVHSDGTYLTNDRFLAGEPMEANDHIWWEWSGNVWFPVESSKIARIICEKPLTTTRVSL